jgi:hypothetical protein
MPSLTSPTPEQLDQAIALLARPEQRRYFFDKLQNPTWLGPLEARGFFSTPPPAVRDDKQGTIHFPPWPASAYLVRMAMLPDAHDDVLRIALNIPTTDNIMAHQDLATIATRLPASMAAQLATRANEWLASPYDRLIDEQLATIIINLAKNGEPTAATALAKTSLAITTKGSESTAHFSPWHYQRLLTNALPALTNAIGLDALKLIADLLAQAAPPYTRNAQPTREDGSRIWHANIETDEDLHGIKNLLVSATRDVARQIAHQSPEDTRNVVAALQARPTVVFHRIALAILRREKDTVPALVAATLNNRDLFDDQSLQYEYRNLLHDAFPQLPPHDQARIVEWISDGPPNDQYQRWETFNGRPATPERQARYNKFWQRAHLTPIADHLPQEWKERYDAIIAELGPEEPETDGGFTGPNSPITKEELASKTPEELIAYLLNWTPTSTDEFKPSRAGIGIDLQSIIGTTPTLLDTVSGEIRNLHPTYVRSYFYGLRDAVEKARPVSWGPILDVARWVVAQPCGERPTDPFREETGWESTRSAIADLLDFALAKATNKKNGQHDQLTIEHRDTVWAIIASLANDPDPTPSYEASYAEDLDPSSLAINTTRGKAIEGVVKYALWVRHQQPSEQTFATMPQVQHVLEDHLAHDPSMAVRSVYGRFFPWLVLLDQAWAANNVTSIFGNARGSAAWEAYLTFCPAYDATVTLLGPYYEAAVQQLDPNRARPERRSKPDPDEHLGEHLMAEYWRGHVPLNDSRVSRFFERAPAHARAHALEYVGRSLYGAKGAVAATIIDRLVALWNARRAAPNPAPGELTTFGWWFASGKLDPAWALRQLQDLLARMRAIDMDTWVLEQLATLASSHALPVLNCLLDLINFGPSWVILGAEKQVSTILTAGLRSSDAAARERANALIHELGVRGHTKFRTLLQPPA